MSRFTQDYTSYNLASWTAPRTWWLDRINWPAAHDNHGFDVADLNNKRILFTRGEHDVEVPESWLDRACEYFANADLESILELRTIRRVERSNHLEVWGPLL